MQNAEQKKLLFSQYFLSVINDLRKDLKISQDDFISRVWPESSLSSNRGRWHAMRTKSYNTQKPRRVTLEDAIAMARILHEPLSRLISLTEHEIKKDKIKSNSNISKRKLFIKSSRILNKT